MSKHCRRLAGIRTWVGFSLVVFSSILRVSYSNLVWSGLVRDMGTDNGVLGVFSMQVIGLYQICRSPGIEDR